MAQPSCGTRTRPEPWIETQQNCPDKMITAIICNLLARVMDIRLSLMCFFFTLFRRYVRNNNLAKVVIVSHRSTSIKQTHFSQCTCSVTNLPLMECLLSDRRAVTNTCFITQHIGNHFSVDVDSFMQHVSFGNNVCAQLFCVCTVVGRCHRSRYRT